ILQLFSVFVPFESLVFLYFCMLFLVGHCRRYRALPAVRLLFCMAFLCSAFFLCIFPPMIARLVMCLVCDHGRGAMSPCENQQLLLVTAVGSFVNGNTRQLFIFSRHCLKKRTFFYQYLQTLRSN
ncbi:unnamed protein product, partial [Pylaiella littoralis]